MAAQPLLRERQALQDGHAGIAFDAPDWPAPPPCPPAPLLCAAWAEAVWTYWRRLLRAGALDPHQPLYLLDLAPGDGTLARHLLERLTAQPGLPPLLYVLCAAQADESDVLLSHPSLRGYADAGVLDALVTRDGQAALSGAGNGGLRLHSGLRLPARPRNPVVVLAWDHFAALPSELHGVHHGAAMRTELTREAQAGQPDALHYAWIPMPAPAPPSAEQDCGHLRDALLAHYVQRCNSNYLLLPLAASAALERLAAWSSGRYLLLGAEYGVCDERQLRLNACCPPPSWPARFPVAVNVHALALAQQWAGAATWCQQLDDGGRVLHMACRGWSSTRAAATLEDVAGALVRAHPDDSPALAAMAAGWDTAQAVALAPAALRLCGHDPALLRACLPALLAGAADCEGCALDAWQTALEATWDRYMPAVRHDDFYAQLAALAARLGHWGLARSCLHAGLGWYGDDAGDLYWLAKAEAATGRHADAQAALERALALAPDDTHCLALQAQLAAAAPGPAWRQPPGSDAELILEPLQAHHAAALLRQYRDPQIAVMTSLPAIETQQQARDWIACENGDPGKLNCAVMHACWGLVGVASLHCSGDAGYFYFWIGCDFQGRGYGPAAAALLWPQVARCGVRCVYTSAFADNARSLRALGLAGFAPLAASALAPDDELVFMGVPLGGAAPSTPQLRALCSAIDSPIQFKPEQEVRMLTAPD
jgi:RimJ/RimL family protein N-acetyltransferase